MPRHTLIFGCFSVAWALLIQPARADDTLKRAEALLAAEDPRSAAAVLERALPTISASEKPALLDLLTSAYERAAERAEAEGRREEAGSYRANLSVLGRKPRPTAAPKKAPAESPGEAPAPLPAPDPLPPPAPLSPPAPPVSAKTQTDPNDDLKAADADFRAKRYAEAGGRYASLAARQALPPTRVDHWAYCRCHVLVARINARPGAEEWPAIREEVASIQKLSPKLWVGEYLRDLIRERSGSTAKAIAATPAKTADANTRRAQTVTDRGPTKPADPKDGFRAVPITSATGPLAQIKLTPNFRIMHEDPALAEKVARIAETTRTEQTRRWTGSAPHEEWTPRCDIYLYNDPKQFAREHNQPEDSPGFSTMTTSGGKISGRRLNLRADHPNLTSAVLPHEVTHVVLADLFPKKPVPRWADEGMAVLSEPKAEQLARAADLEAPLASGRIFQVQQLMSMDYPDGRFWGLYYAQSVSLTQYLVSIGSPAKFIEVLKGAEKNGLEEALKRTYGIDGFAELQRGWVDFARGPDESVADSRTR